MALTDHSDVFGSVSEDGINEIVRHIQRQRPSLFHYGTVRFLRDPGHLCERIEPHPEVTRRGNPLITVEPPLPIPGTGGAWGLDFCIQIMELQVDFHPDDVVALPDELSPPLPEQALALRGRACAGIGCPGEENSRQYEVEVPPVRMKGGQVEGGEFDPSGGEAGPRGPRQLIPASDLACFCLELFAVLHAERRGSVLALVLDGLELVDIEPEGLENGLECYVATFLRVGMLPRLRIALDTIALELGEWLTLVPTPLGPDVPHNPSVAHDELSVFLDLQP